MDTVDNIDKIESQLSENALNPQYLEKAIQAEENEDKEEEKEKEWDVKPKFLAPLIDFDELLKELRSNSTEMIDLNRVSKGTQTKTKRLTQIKNVAKSNFFITAVVAFVFFASSTFDVITDGNLTYSFVNGTYYIKRLQSRPDSQLWYLDSNSNLQNKANLWNPEDKWNLCILDGTDLENDPDFSGIKDFTQLVVIRNEKNLSYTSFNDRRVLKQALDYSTPQVWKKYNEREDGSFWLSSIEVGEFDSTESPLVIPDSDSDESVDNSTDLLTAVTASENVNDQLVVKGSLENLVGDCRTTKRYTIDLYQDGQKKSKSSYEYECFEKDPVWGWVSFSFMCVPGFFFWVFISYSVSKANYLPETSHRWLGYLYFALLVLAMVPLVVLYPLLLIVVKFVSIFHHGVQWQKLNNFMTLFEGQIEGYLQVGLQSYIVCSRADRVPSAPQIIALVTSVIMILLAQTKAWYANQPEINVFADIKRKIVIAVLLLIPNLAVFGSGLIIAVTLFSHQEWGKSYRSLNTMLVGIGILIMICCFCVYWFFWRKWNWDTHSHCCAKPRLRKIILHYIFALSFLGLLLLVIWTTVDVNYHQVNYLAFIVQETHKFNVLAGIVFGVGFFPLTIFLLGLFCLAQPNTKERILTGIPLVILLILGISLILSLYQSEYIRNLNPGLDITNNKEPIPGYDNNQIGIDSDLATTQIDEKPIASDFAADQIAANSQQERYCGRFLMVDDS